MVKFFSKKEPFGPMARRAAFLAAGAALLASSACAPWRYPVYYQYRPPQPLYNVYVPGIYVLPFFLDDRPRRGGFLKHQLKGGGHHKRPHKGRHHKGIRHGPRR
ncbi:MAG TPA: hypothetical protein DD400_01390 [Rhodospirillaceae bacterium]|nr:hypothetical protein [Rhodospirillaceae bacterium]